MRDASRRFLSRLFVGLAFVCCAGVAAAQDVPRLRLSTENAPTHVHTRIVQRFVERVEREAAGRLIVDYQHSARLFRDADVVRALRTGQIEMAVPGTWQLDRIEPNLAVFLLPQFYGLGSAANYRVRDGALGRVINQRLADRLRLQVLGRWIDLGFAHIYMTGTAIQAPEGLAGLRIRLPGSEASAWRLRQLGAQPHVIPWPDVPNALHLRTIEGLVSTHESVETADLMRHGVRSVYEDHAYFAQYLPLVAGAFWARLDPALQRLLADSWEAVVDEARTLAAIEQEAARARLIAAGVRIFTPPAGVLADTRRRLLSRQSELVAQLGIDPALVAMAAEMTAGP
jgi:TRAP-type C4-dicarboxylate transport system substrate-binding protein